MIIKSICFQCGFEANVTAHGDVDQNLLVQMQCPYGHSQVNSIRNHLYEALYHSAVDAYISGFYSESVLGFNAALERAFELFIKISLINEGLESNEIDNFWKEIRNQSERQYGAFCIQYMKTTKKVWRADSEQVGFRNSVVHKGFIMPREKVSGFAEYVTQRLLKIRRSLSSELIDASNMYEKMYLHAKEEEQRELCRKKGKTFVIHIPFQHLDSNQLELKHEEITFERIIEKYLKTKPDATS
ncbi:MAG: hypothetical protein KC547_16970 [Anaerolineae bacterium]|nr:hypothetical protein [Anaerolineae bacterium]